MLHKGKLFIHWVATDYEWEKGGHIAYERQDFTLRKLEDGSTRGIEGWTLLGTIDIECEIADIDSRQKLIESLQAKKAEIISVATREAEKLEDKIQQLLALPVGKSALGD
jgi:hypothetical protein